MVAQSQRLLTLNEDEFLNLSGIQHFSFCKRQWALGHIELLWEENIRTVEGEIMHEKAHDPYLKEKRKDLIISRALPIHSNELGISGECDVVEFHKDENGIPIFGYDGKYFVVPIEYKRGAPKVIDADLLQLTAQAICLEEMLCCEIEYGFIYYGEKRKREKILFTEDLRQKVRDTFEEMHKYYNQRHTPKVKISKMCNACSLRNLCVPYLNKNISVKDYIDTMLNEEDNSQ